MKKSGKRILALALMLLLTFGIFCQSGLIAGAGAVTQSDIDNLKQQKEALEQQRQDLLAQIEDAEFDLLSVTAQRKVLDERMTLTQQEINNVSEQIETCLQMIDQKEAEVETCKKQEDAQWKLYKSRLRAMEENGTISYFSIIFGATSFSDLLSRIDYISEIIDYDEKVYNDLLAAQADTEQAIVGLEKVNAEYAQEKSELEALHADLAVQSDEASQLIASLEDKIDEYNALDEEMNAEMDALQDDIDAKVAELEEQKRREEEERNKQNGGGGNGGVTGTGSFIWPCPSSNYITSRFGTRFHPIYQVYKTHYGVDVGASYGSSIYAADGGTVLTSTYSSSYGYYIVIYHGNGTTTLYAHLSQLLVSAGDSVSQGELIAYSGNSGASTGPHLHFEVSVGGSRVNPLDYFDSGSFAFSPSA